MPIILEDETIRKRGWLTKRGIFFNREINTPLHTMYVYSALTLKHYWLILDTDESPYFVFPCSCVVNLSHEVINLIIQIFRNRTFYQSMK